MRLLLALLLALVFFSCKKDEEPVAEPTCKNETAIAIDTGNAYFTLPTGFTPNGDGLNDYLSAFVENIDTTGFSIVIKEGETTAFESDNPYFIWQPGHYIGRRAEFSVDVKFRTAQGARIETCAPLTIPRADSFATCVQDIAGLQFADQINIATGKFQYATAERPCP